MTTSFLYNLQNLDANTLLFLNGFHNSVLDCIMYAVTGKWIWVPLYVLLTFILIRKDKIWHGLIMLFFIIIAVAMSDQICATIIRPLAERMRPANPNNPLSAFVHTVNGYHGGKYGFPSCHASNSFALATFLSLHFKRRVATIALISWAILLCFSRIYLGVHYPGDIICGGIIGFIIGASSYFTARFLWEHGRVILNTVRLRLIRLYNIQQTK